ncbi:HD-GYP domain-containing protein [Anaerovorax odorimutans]|uniref:HD-GYP domain-containing protein n=1 Tax=Anaerovorax odorimutans TaxID=109327 RepID=UPI00068753CF|nr:HD-GYP domain-containing protein [Anaerovorax odorimutans]
MKNKQFTDIRTNYLFFILIFFNGIGFFVLNSIIQNNQDKFFSFLQISLFWLLLISLFITTIFLLIYFFIVFRMRLYKNREDMDKKIIIQSLNTFANFIDAKDSYTKGHSTRVALYSHEIAKRMKLTEKEMDIYYAALLHDVGKVGIHNEILDKLDELNDEEWQTIKMHTIIGEDILKDFTILPDIIDGAKYHHERYDGLGYPSGLKGKDIPLCARIICVADSYDAMSSDRNYRKKMDYDEIVEELYKYSGTQFDPDITIHMISMIEDGFVNEIQKV